MPEKLKTFINQKVTNEDFVDGKFTILENDTTTQAVIKSVTANVNNESFKLKNGDTAIGTLSNQEGSELIDVSSNLTMEVEGEETYNYAVKPTPDGLVLSALEETLKAPFLLPADLPITGDADDLILDSVINDGGDKVLTLRNASPQANKRTTYTDTITLSLDEMVNGVLTPVTTWDHTDLLAMFGAVLTKAYYFCLTKDHIQDKIYLFSRAVTVSQQDYTPALAVFNEDTNDWTVLSDTVKYGSQGSFGFNFVAIDGYGFTTYGASNGQGLWAVDLETGKKDYYVYNFNSRVFTYGSHKGLWVVKTGDGEGEFIIGSSGPSSSTAKRFAAAFKLPKPTGANLSLADFAAGPDAGEDVLSVSAPVFDNELNNVCVGKGKLCALGSNPRLISSYDINVGGSSIAASVDDPLVGFYTTGRNINYQLPAGRLPAVDLEFDLKIAGVEITGVQ